VHPGNLQPEGRAHTHSYEAMNCLAMEEFTSVMLPLRDAISWDP
jgi:hypothetical protein